MNWLKSIGASFLVVACVVLIVVGFQAAFVYGGKIVLFTLTAFVALVFCTIIFRGAFFNE